MHTSKLLLNLPSVGYVCVCMCAGFVTGRVKKAITTDVTAAQHIHMLPQLLLSLRNLYTAVHFLHPPPHYYYDASCMFGPQLTVWLHHSTCYSEARVSPFIRTKRHTNILYDMAMQWKPHFSVIKAAHLLTWGNLKQKQKTVQAFYRRFIHWY